MKHSPSSACSASILFSTFEFQQLWLIVSNDLSQPFTCRYCSYFIWSPYPQSPFQITATLSQLMHHLRDSTLCIELNSYSLAPVLDHSSGPILGCSLGSQSFTRAHDFGPLYRLLPLKAEDDLFSSICPAKTLCWNCSGGTTPRWWPPSGLPVAPSAYLYHVIVHIVF